MKCNGSLEALTWHESWIEVVGNCVGILVG